MNRKDWVWVVIKAFGIYFGIETLLMAPSFMFIFQARMGAGDALISLLPRFILQGALSVYLLKSGGLVFRLIGPIAPSSDSAP